MKNQVLRLITLLFICLQCITITAQPDKKIPNVLIKGIIHDYVPEEEKNQISMHAWNLGKGDQSAYRSDITKDGKFEISFHVDHQQDVYFLYANQLLTLLLSPGDSLFIQFSDIDFKNAEQAEKILKITGTAAEVNQLMLNFYTLYSPQKEYYAEDVFKNTEPVAYKKLVFDHYNKDLILLENFIKDNKINNQIFIKWARYHLYYGVVSTLNLFPMRYALLNKRQPYEEKLPKEYYSYLADFNLNDEDAIIASNYNLALQRYKYILDIEMWSDSSLVSKIRSKEFSQWEVLFNKIDALDGKIIKDVMLTQLFYSTMENPRILNEIEPLLERYYQTVENEDFKQLITSRYKAMRYEDGKDITLSKKITLWNAPDSLLNVVQKIAAQHKGKIIYIDFWATWCKPCMQEFSLYSELRAKFNRDKIVFVFLGMRSPQGLWKRRIGELNLEGVHYLLNDKQSEALIKEFTIEGIPHHIIIGKNGEIIQNKAPKVQSPSEYGKLNSELITLFNALLND